MKFKFELDGIDAENLYGLFRSAQLKSLGKMLDFRDECKRSRFDWEGQHLHYLNELEAMVFNRDVEYTKLPTYGGG